MPAFPVGPWFFFAYHRHEAAGGMGDFRGTAPSEAAALALVAPFLDAPGTQYPELELAVLVGPHLMLVHSWSYGAPMSGRAAGATSGPARPGSPWAYTDARALARQPDAVGRPYALELAPLLVAEGATADMLDRWQGTPLVVEALLEAMVAQGDHTLGTAAVGARLADPATSRRARLALVQLAALRDPGHSRSPAEAGTEAAPPPAGRDPAGPGAPDPSVSTHAAPEPDVCPAHPGLPLRLRLGRARRAGRGRGSEDPGGRSRVLAPSTVVVLLERLAEVAAQHQRVDTERWQVTLSAQGVHGARPWGHAPAHGHAQGPVPSPAQVEALLRHPREAVRAHTLRLLAPVLWHVRAARPTDGLGGQGARVTGRGGVSVTDPASGWAPFVAALGGRERGCVGGGRPSSRPTGPRRTPRAWT